MENNNKILIVKILILVLVVSGLIMFIFYLNKQTEQPYTVEDEKIKKNMASLSTIAEGFKETNGSYNYGNKSVSVDYCELNQESFAGTGNGHILCSNIMNHSSGKLVININSVNDSPSKYCFQKELSGERNWCIDSTGYSGLSSACDDYKCKQ